MADTANRRQTLETQDVIINPYRFAVAATTPPTINNRQLVHSDSVSGTTYTMPNYVVSAGDNRVLLVFVTTEDGTLPTLSGVTFGGTALTALTSVGFTGYLKMVCYYLIAPSVTTGDIVVTFNATTTGDFAILACYLTGASQSGVDVYDTDVATSGSDQTLNFDITTSVGNCVGLLCAAHYHIEACGSIVDWTEAVDQVVASHRLTFHTRDLISAANYTPAWSTPVSLRIPLGICLAWGPP